MVRCGYHSDDTKMVTLITMALLQVPVGACRILSPGLQFDGLAQLCELFPHCIPDSQEKHAGKTRDAFGKWSKNSGSQGR